MVKMKTKNESKNSKSWLKSMPLISIGWELALPIFGGVIIGYYLDRVISTKYIFTITFLLIGIGTGYYNLYKYIDLEMLRTRFAEKQDQEAGRRP